MSNAKIYDTVGCENICSADIPNLVREAKLTYQWGSDPAVVVQADHCQICRAEIHKLMKRFFPKCAVNGEKENKKEEGGEK